MYTISLNPSPWCASDKTVDWRVSLSLFSAEVCQSEGLSNRRIIKIHINIRTLLLLMLLFAEHIWASGWDNCRRDACQSHSLQQFLRTGRLPGPISFIPHVSAVPKAEQYLWSLPLHFGAIATDCAAECHCDCPLCHAASASGEIGPGSTAWVTFCDTPGTIAPGHWYPGGSDGADGNQWSGLLPSVQWFRSHFCCGW